MTLIENLGEDNCLIVLLVAGAINQRCPLASGHRAQSLERRGILLELGAIAAAKLCPPRRIMAEPTAERGARRDFFQPMIDPGLFFAEPTRPDAIDEHSHAVRMGGCIIDALHPHR